MTICRQIVFLDGTLRGEGRQRACRVKATRNSEFPDESGVPVSVAYCRCEIDDSDDFPDGDYELEFDGHTLMLSKQGGQYLTRLEVNSV